MLTEAQLARLKILESRPIGDLDPTDQQELHDLRDGEHAPEYGGQAPEQPPQIERPGGREAGTIIERDPFEPDEIDSIIDRDPNYLE